MKKIINRYSYEELAAAAMSVEATQEDIDALGEWFESYGRVYWNGEYYDIDGSHSLRPVYSEPDENDCCEIISYRLG
jgi:hypothetical protein